MIKEAKRTGRYSQDIRTQTLRVTFKMELCSQVVLKQTKLAIKEKFIRGDRPREEYEKNKEYSQKAEKGGIKRG